jgi:hypothetical protein
VFEKDREQYDLAVEMLREQLPVRHIAKTAQISFSTIQLNPASRGLISRGRKRRFNRDYSRRCTGCRRAGFGTWRSDEPKRGKYQPGDFG